MKTRSTLLVAAFLALAVSLFAGPRDAQWKLVEEAASKGLPKSAIEHLEPIIAGALADHAHGEAIKAINRKVVLEGYIQGNQPGGTIILLQNELEKAPAAMKPVMETMLAHAYWQYFQQNRWRFTGRTQTSAPPGSDIQTWDLARILTETDKHFTAALTDKAALQKIPVAAFDDLLPKGTAPDTYRPTLYDFLAQQALLFYQAGEQGALQAEDDFSIDADSPIFANAETFLAWQPATTDTDSPLLKAILLYQELLRFHQADPDRSAFLDADLARIVLGSNFANDEIKGENYKAALRRFIAATERHEISARALAGLATLLNSEGNPAEARVLAQRGLDAFPNTAGGTLCANLIKQIETKSAQLATEFVWNAPWPTLNVTYRNVTKVYFRAFAMDFKAHLLKSSSVNLSLTNEELEALLATKPALAWSNDLPATADFLQRTEKLAAPTTLTPGYYYIFASHNPDFSYSDNQIAGVAIWVSKLALVIMRRSDGHPSEGFVLHNNTGQPVAGAKVRIWQQQSGNRELKLLYPRKTDANGRFPLPSSEKYDQYIFLAESDSEAVSSVGVIGTRPTQSLDVEAYEATQFFTDRALYRPGQSIQYKGICFTVGQTHDSYKVLADQPVTVTFSDANGRKIASASHRTNSFGSFSGVFTAPPSQPTGSMYINVAQGPGGSAGFSVEEYKRPKFQVSLAAPGVAAKLGAPITIAGTSAAYSGAGINQAKVKWRVERSSQPPDWCWWVDPVPAKAVAHGTSFTDVDGTFRIEFNVTPDPSIPERNEPVFTYTVYADVTDSTGETRSTSRTIRAGYTALQSSLSADDWQTAGKPVELTISTSTLDGVPQSAEGTLSIHALRQPERVERAPLGGTTNAWVGREGEPPVDPANPDTWATVEQISLVRFSTDSSGTTRISAPLQPGIYRASLETKDRFGKNVTARRIIQVLNPDSTQYTVKLANLFAAPKWSVEPGNTFTAYWGTGYDSGRAFVEISCNGKILKRYWTAAGHTQERIDLPVTEEMRGGFALRVFAFRENRVYFNSRIVEVPWSNKQLVVKWERFRSKLLPGQEESWIANVTGPNAERTAVEMVAALYDASLDQYRTHHWPDFNSSFRAERGSVAVYLQNINTTFGVYRHNWTKPSGSSTWTYRNFPYGMGLQNSQYSPGSADGNGWFYALGDELIVLTPFTVNSESDKGYDASNTLAGTRMETQLKDLPASISVLTKELLQDTGVRNDELLAYTSNTEGGGLRGNFSAKPDLSKVTARKNLNETAFFFPHLLTDVDGVVKIQFTMPEALTEWKFMGFAHDKNLRSGFLTGKVVTAKDLMVEPNPPRFVREGDAIEFTVKVSNQSDQPQTGQVRLTFSDAATLKSADAALGNRVTGQSFDVPAKQSRSYSWRIAVPDGMGYLTYKAVGATNTLSDGEEGFLPVLSRRILVTESLPLPMRGKTTKQFDFAKLTESGKSDTLRNQSLTVQMVSQPAWYAVMALPYLMEFPHECSEQLFSRFYANTLARHIARSDPKIRRVFDLWKGTSSLDSPLTKNQDLKSVMIEETPWLRQATTESESRRNLGLLFDTNRLDEESAHALNQLAERQLSDGLWSWFPGGRSSEYISLTIMTGFGRLRHLGVDVDVTPAITSLAGLDAWMSNHYRNILTQAHPEHYVPDALDALYLYSRSFFLKDQPLTKEHQITVDFFLRQSRQYWLKAGSRISQAHLAIALQRFGDKETPPAIMKSLRERSVSSEELGMFWRDQELNWWWYHAPIETQAMMIEAFDEVAHDAQAVEDCKVWLLKQKQTQDWKTTKATADAIYALLLHGENLIASDALVEVSLGSKTIKPEKVEAGTGFYEQKSVRDEIKPAMGQITVKKTDAGVSWGSVHWQYLEDMTKVTPHEGTPLKLKKTLWVKETTNKGPVLKPVTGPLSVGDELVVRLELRTDRDMEYVHLKDQRGSGTEPVNVLSQYKYQDGLGYYESTRDTASHFFIDYLPKGTYVFEYSTRIQLKGSYQSGIAEIQCMYAPEFNSHSESFTLEVK